MSDIEIRKPLHDVLVTEFRTLKFANSTASCFVDVQKYYTAPPSAGTPFCRIIPISVANNIIGNTSDERLLGFQCLVHEYIEGSEDQTDGIDKIDRLEGIEDRIMAYLQKIPNNVEYDVSNVHVHEVQVDPGIYSFERSESGIVITQVINFTLKVLVTPQNL